MNSIKVEEPVDIKPELDTSIPEDTQDVPMTRDGGAQREGLPHVAGDPAEGHDYGVQPEPDAIGRPGRRPRFRAEMWKRCDSQPVTFARACDIILQKATIDPSQVCSMPPLIVDHPGTYYVLMPETEKVKHSIGWGICIRRELRRFSYDAKAPIPWTRIYTNRNVVKPMHACIVAKQFQLPDPKYPMTKTIYRLVYAAPELIDNTNRVVVTYDWFEEDEGLGFGVVEAYPLSPLPVNVREDRNEEADPASIVSLVR